MLNEAVHASTAVKIGNEREATVMQTVASLHFTFVNKRDLVCV